MTEAGERQTRAIARRLRNQEAHAINRAWERYRLRLRPADMERLQQRLKAGEGRRCYCPKNHRGIREIEVGGVICRILYRSGSGRILTFLSPADRAGLGADPGE